MDSPSRAQRPSVQVDDRERFVRSSLASLDISTRNEHTLTLSVPSVNTTPFVSTTPPRLHISTNSAFQSGLGPRVGVNPSEPNGYGSQTQTQAQVQGGDLTSLSAARPSHQKLPQLCIPNQLQRPPSTLSTKGEGTGIGSHADQQHQADASSETPTSLSSPIVGVVDLTKSLRTTSAEPVIHGGFSDIYRGEWERECVLQSGADEKGYGGGVNGSGREVEIVQVAIKLLRVLSSKGYDEVKARKRLNREVYVWHRLEHPNIATFLGTSYHMSGRPSLVLPWFKNGSASDYLNKNPKADRIKLILDVAKGLEYLHTLKPAPIVHGDLKGNNILITDDGHAILTDFGLSQVIEDLVGPTGITPSQAGAGPIRWQAPESLMDESCRPKIAGDVWSFGCTAYELLTGNIPYHFRVKEAMVIQDIQNGVKPPGVGEVREHCGSGGIWDILDDCWADEPCDRISMTEVVLRLRGMCG